MAISLHTFADRPDLADRGIPSAEVWPEYNLHGDVLNPYWGPLLEELPEYQLVMLDEATGQVVGELHTGPMPWDGDDDHLPDGIDAAIVRIVEGRRSGRPVNTLCALAAEISPSAQGAGLAAQAVRAMRDLADAHGLRWLVARCGPHGRSATH
jgi:RimJ/RimL family protein N-acetyltransferase